MKAFVWKIPDKSLFLFKNYSLKNRGNFMKDNYQKRKFKLTIFIIILLVIFLKTNIMASDNSNDNVLDIENITVIATKTPKIALETPASTSTINEEKINAFISEHPFKPLTMTEGVWARQYRGLGDYWARPVFRGHRALIMVDGVNWYDYGYYYHTGAIPMPDMERIDVVRGPFSALYGTLAQTAVINYTTKIPDKPVVSATASYGDWDSSFYSIRFADRPFSDESIGGGISWLKNTIDDRFFYSFSFKSRTSDGYKTTPSYKSLGSPYTDPLDPDTPIVTGWAKDINPQTGKYRYMIGHQGDNWYKDYGIFLKTGYDLTPDTRLWYSLNISEFEYGWKDGRSFLVDPLSGATLYDDEVYIQDNGNTYEVTLTPFLFTSDPKTKKSIVHTMHLNHSTPNLVDITGVFAFNDKNSSTHYVRAGRYKVEDNYLAQADLTATFHMIDSKCLLTLGLQGIQESVTVKDKNLSDQYSKSSVINIKEKTAGKNRVAGTIVQLEYSPVDFLTAYIGGRYDKWWGFDANYSNIDGNYIKHKDINDEQFSPKASLVLRPLKNGSIRLSYGEAFTAPSLYYRTATYYWESGGTISKANPNPNLDPTRNKSWELGTEWEFFQRRLKFKTTYFENDFKDLIVNKTTVTTLPGGTILKEKQRINAEKAEVNGIETAIEAILPFNLKTGIYHTYNWSKYLKTYNSSKKGWEMDETPTEMWSMWLGYFGRYLDATMSYRYCDSRYDNEKTQYDDTTYTGDDDYHVADAKVTFKPMEHLSFSIAVDNLFDENYYEYYRAPGRFWLGTVKMSF